MGGTRFRLPILAIVLGACGAVLLVLGILGLQQEPVLAVLGDPGLSTALIATGILLILAETVLVIAAVRRQARRRR